MASPVFPQVGVMFNKNSTGPNGYSPAFTQPGGPGTPTFPQQTVGEILGLWIAGCGHSMNHWLVECAENQDLVPSAVIMCPLCRYVQRIIVPFNAIYDEANEIIFA